MCAHVYAVAEAAPRTVALPMYDQWCYYYRLSVVMLFEGLPRGSYTARIWLDELQPNRQFTRRPAPPGIQVLAAPQQIVFSPLDDGNHHLRRACCGPGRCPPLGAARIDVCTGSGARALRPKGHALHSCMRQALVICS
jgi:hypothetical protein